MRDDRGIYILLIPEQMPFYWLIWGYFDLIKVTWKVILGTHSFEAPWPIGLKIKILRKSDLYL